MVEPEPEVVQTSIEVSEPGESPIENLSPEAEARIEAEHPVNASEEPRA
jgi:hypothetical protein